MNQISPLAFVHPDAKLGDADNTENFAKVAGQKAKELQAEMALELAKI